jgi:hypothetical protein
MNIILQTFGLIGFLVLLVMAVIYVSQREW